MIKKLTLLLACSFWTFAGYSQSVILNVQHPSSIAGLYNHTNNGDASGWGLPNLLDPADAILDTLVVMDDGSTGTNNSYGYSFPQSLCGCDSAGVANSPVNYSGKIVLISRGSCQFGTKAYYAQLRGAVGVIIYNAVLDNAGGGIIGMGAGVHGGNVTIPVAFVANGDGITFKTEIDAGTPVVAFLGAKVGAFQNDLAMSSDKVLSPPQMARPQLISADSNMYQVPLGFWMRNDGVINQTAAYASAEVTYNGSTVYTNTTNTFGLNYGDSSWISFPPFAQSAYPNGEYIFTYTVGISGGTDDFPSDNEISYTVRVNDEIYSYARVDEDFQPLDNVSLLPGGTWSVWAPALHFSHSDASKMTLDGVKFAAYMSGGDSITGRVVDIAVYEWNDVFTGLNDINISTSTLTTPLVSEPYMFMGEYQDTAVTHLFSTPIQLADDQRYVVAVVSANTDMYINFSRDPSYGFNDQQLTAQPVDLIMLDGTFYDNGFNGYVPTIQLIMGQSSVSIDETVLDVKPFPIPAAHILNIPVPNVDASISLMVYDMAGNLVLSQSEIQKDGNVLKVDVSALPAATYVFNLMMQDGKASNFNVVVGR